MCTSGMKRKGKPCVCRKTRSSIVLLSLDRPFNLSLNLSQGSHQTPSLVLRLLRIRNRSLEFGIPRYFELLARRAKYSTYSQLKLKTKTSPIFFLNCFQIHIRTKPDTSTPGKKMDSNLFDVAVTMKFN